MPSAPVVAAPASPHNCLRCGTVLGSAEERATAWVCSSCGRLQPVRPEETYYSALGTPLRLKLDGAGLEKRFYELSRALHPDRFTTSDAENRRNSVDRMTFVNDAYRTLKTPALRRAYFLKLLGVATEQKSKAGIPAELAEAWFEVQDALHEEPAQAAERFRAFETTFNTFRARNAEKIAVLENELDEQLAKTGPATDTIRQLALALQAEVLSEGYLVSMTQDMERIKKQLH